MSKFNFFVELEDFTASTLNAFHNNFLNQTNPDWALHLLCIDTDKEAQNIGNNIAGPNVLVHLVPALEPLATSVNKLLPSLEADSWVGFMRIRDALKPNAVEALANAPTAKILCTNSIRRSQHGFCTMQSDKRAVDPIRLRSQNYLDDLLMIQKEWLQELGGFDARSSDSLTHDILLKTVEVSKDHIVILDEPLLYVFRDHRELGLDDSRLKHHMPRYDLWAIRQHYARMNIHATVDQYNGSVATNIHHQFRWPVSVVVIAPKERHELIAMALATGTHKPVQLVFLEQATPAELNQLIKTLEGPLVAILRGVPVSTYWLAEMVDWAMLPNMGVITGKTIYRTRLTFPGTFGAIYENRDWNSRGDFNNLQVPKQTIGITDSNMLTDIQNLLQFPFNENLSQMYAMAHGTEVHRSGKTNIFLPLASSVMVDETEPVSLNEAAVFAALYPQWSDEFGLYLSM